MRARPLLRLTASATAATLAAAAGGCVPLLVGEARTAVAEYERLVGSASPVAGTYRLVYAFPDGDTLTLYARTLARPLVPVLAGGGGDDADDFDEGWEVDLAGTRLPLVGQALRIYSATSIDSLPAATADVVFEGGTPRNGGTLIALVPPGAPPDPDGFAGAWATRLPEGTSEVFDRHREVLEARLTELYPFFEAAREMGAPPSWDDEAPLPRPPATAWFTLSPEGLRAEEVYRRDGGGGYELEAERVSGRTVELAGRGAGAVRGDDVTMLGAPPGARRRDLRSLSRLGLIAIASPPELLAGVGAVGLPRRGFGLFFDAQWNPFRGSTAEPHDTASVVTAEQVRGHPRVGETTDWVLLHGGVTRTLTRRLALYGGVGIGLAADYAEYQGTLPSLPFDDRYWISDGMRLVPNATGGVLVLLGRDFMAQLGVHARPRAYTLGLGYTVPYHRIPPF